MLLQPFVANYSMNTHPVKRVKPPLLLVLGASKIKNVFLKLVVALINCIMAGCLY